MLKIFSIKSDFTRNTAHLITGTVIAQSIPILLQPILRRIYSPEDFGAMALYLTFFSMLSIVSSLRYEAAIVLPRSNQAAANIMSLGILINIFFAIIILSAILFFKNDFAQLINLPDKYSNYLYFLPFACLAFGIYQNMNYWLVRQKAFRASAANKITRRAVEGILQTTAGALRFRGGLFLGDLTGHLANLATGTYQIFKKDFNIRFISPKKICWAFIKYIDFPKYNAIPTLLSNAATVLPFLFINKLYSTETVGYLDLSRLVLSIPLVFIAATVSQVFFQQTTYKKNNSLTIIKDVMEIFYLLLLIIIIEMVLIFLWGPELFGFIFGESYTISGLFSQVLIFSFTLNLIASTFSTVFITFDKIRVNSIWQITYFLAICSLLLFKGLDIYDFLMIYVAVEIVMLTIYCGMIFFIIRSYEKKIKTKISL